MIKVSTCIIEEYIAQFHAAFCIRTDDREVANKIALKFGNPEVEGISFCNIAKKAEEVGKRELAIMVRRNGSIFPATIQVKMKHFSFSNWSRSLVYKFLFY